MTYRIIIAVVLCFVAMIVINTVMQLLFPPQPKKQPTEKIEKEIKLSDQDRKTTEDGEKITQPKITEQIKPTTQKQSDKTEIYLLENDEIKIEITNKNASIKSLFFKKYKSPNDRKADYEFLSEIQKDLTSLSLFLENQDKSTPLLWFLDNYEKDKEVKMHIEFDGLKITKTFSLSDISDFVLNYRIEIEATESFEENNSTAKSEKTTRLEIYGPCGVALETGSLYYLKGILGLKEESWESKSISFSSVKKENYISDRDDLQWGGVADKYFVSILIPLSQKISKIPQEFGFSNFNFSALTDTAYFEELKKKGADTKEAINRIAFFIRTKELKISKDQPKQTLDFILYTGPIQKSELSKLSEYGLPIIESYGTFGFISSILLSCLGFFYSIFQNYGVGIIFLTILVKVVLFPLTKKGQVSAYRLQKLQPRINSLREKYKNDRKKMNEEMLKLYREFGVSPFSGCLPLLLQIPVFIGLYRALELSIDLRQAPFMLWINDLSQPDRLTKLPFSILGATDLNLLPILMTICWMVQTMMQPKSPDPQARAQQKIFMFMPLIFSLLLYNMPAGLILYWLVSTFLGIIEQKIIKKVYLKG